MSLVSDVRVKKGRQYRRKSRPTNHSERVQSMTQLQDDTAPRCTDLWNVPLVLAVEAVASSRAMIVDEDTLIEYMNRACTDWLEARIEPETKAHFADCFSDDLGAEFEQIELDVLRSGIQVTVDCIVRGEGIRTQCTQIRFADRQRPVVLVTITPLRCVLWSDKSDEHPPIVARHHDLGFLRQLTPRETQILAMIAQGRTTNDIADLLGRSRRTIDCHRSAISSKLNVPGVAGLTALALTAGLVRITDSTNASLAPPLVVNTPLLSRLLESKRTGNSTSRLN